MKKYSILMYDEDETLMNLFETPKDCAYYFKTTQKTIYCYFLRKLRNEAKKIKDKRSNKWVTLEKVYEGEENE